MFEVSGYSLCILFLVRVSCYYAVSVCLSGLWVGYDIRLECAALVHLTVKDFDHLSRKHLAVIPSYFTIGYLQLQPGYKNDK